MAPVARRPALSTPLTTHASTLRGLPDCECEGYRSAAIIGTSGAFASHQKSAGTGSVPVGLGPEVGLNGDGVSARHQPRHAHIGRSPPGKRRFPPPNSYLISNMNPRVIGSVCWPSLGAAGRESGQAFAKVACCQQCASRNVCVTTPIQRRGILSMTMVLDRAELARSHNPRICSGADGHAWRRGW